jgi:hypothetical protein
MTFNYQSALSAFEGDGKPVNIEVTGTNTFNYVNAGSDYGVVAITSASRTLAGLVTITAASHGFAALQSVVISGMSDSSFNGTYSIITAGTNTFTYQSATKKVTSSGSLTYTNAKAYSTLAISSSTAYIEYEAYGKTEDIVTVQSTGTTVVLGVENHDYRVGDLILVHIYGSAYKAYNNSGEPVRVTAITDSTLTYTLATSPGDRATTSVTGQVAYAAQVEKRPLAISRSYGEFPENSDLGGVEFSDENYSDLLYQNTLLRGSDLTNVAEFLDGYSNSINGFDYRIDCSMVYDEFNNKKFKRTFVLVPRIPETLKEYKAGLPDGKLPAGEYAPPSAFGADKIVFEYPGNVGNFGITESSSAAATRVFVVGNNDDLGAGASARYSAASNTDLLNDGWPLLDRVEKQEWPVYGVNVINVDNYGNYDAEMDLNKTANRFLDESKPPMGEISISVNGSLNPIIGTYNPGEWCSIILNDPFFQSRLASNLEPRKNVVIRKIDRINVTVPNNPAFPEQVTLDLLPEWEIDKRGQ